MSIKIQADDMIVIDYLKQLWNNNKSENKEEKQEEIIVELDEKKENKENKDKDKNKFSQDIKDKLHALRDVGFRVYHNIGLEKEVNLEPKTVSKKDIDMTYTFKNGSNLTRKQLMTNICKTTVFPKHKGGVTSDPQNFRYLVNHHNTIKILDRLWVLETMEKIGKNGPDPEIYKSNLVKNFSPNIIYTAMKNTQSLDSIAMLDITRAFDSLDWDVLEELLVANITRKTNKETAMDIVSQYIIILKNRVLYYNDIIIPISKGIPTGLPSSNLVFTLALEEIIYRWMTKNNYVNNSDFMINVYVDDIYIKIINLLKTHVVVYGLIDFLAEYKLYVNKIKSKASYNLDLTEIANELKESDYYLGIPFTRNKTLYGELILKEFQTKKMNWDWNQIYDKITEEEYSEEQSVVFGFMNYKLKPIMKDEPINKIIIGKFIHDTYIKETKVTRMFNCIKSFFSSLF